MSREEAEALAQKREAHKSKHMTDKEWRAVHDSVKGWHAALVDSHVGLIRKEFNAQQDMREALRTRDFDSFNRAAFEGLMIRIRRSFGDAA